MILINDLDRFLHVVPPASRLHPTHAETVRFTKAVQTPRHVDP